jgi:hypothetical protein
MLCAAALLAGCASQRQANGPTPKPIITADLRPVGTVVLVNADARFAVVSFPNGVVPQPGQMLGVYHKGLKAADLKVSGPQHDNITVGDILAGAPQAQDEVRTE